MVEIDDTEKAKRIAKEWAENIVGKESKTVKDIRVRSSFSTLA